MTRRTVYILTAENGSGEEFVQGVFTTVGKAKAAVKAWHKEMATTAPKWAADEGRIDWWHIPTGSYISWPWKISSAPFDPDKIASRSGE